MVLVRGRSLRIMGLEFKMDLGKLPLVLVIGMTRSRRV